jgi:hypothetical protein
MLKRIPLMILFGVLVLGCGQREGSSPTEGLKAVPDIVERRAQFVEQFLDADVSHLSAGDREALKHLVAAARAVDEIFRLQAWAGNPGFAPEVAALVGSAGPS